MHPGTKGDTKEFDIVSVPGSVSAPPVFFFQLYKTVLFPVEESMYSPPGKRCFCLGVGEVHLANPGSYISSCFISRLM